MRSCLIETARLVVLVKREYLLVLTAENCQILCNVLAGKLFEKGIISEIYPLYTGRKVIVRKMFRSHPGCQFTPCVEVDCEYSLANLLNLFVFIMVIV